MALAVVSRSLTRSYVYPPISVGKALFLGPFTLFPYNSAAFLFAFCFSVFPVMFVIATRSSKVRRFCAVIAFVVWAICVAYSQELFGRI